MKSKILLIFIVVVFCVPVIQGQKAVVANAGMNVIYTGLINKIDVLKEGVGRKNIEIKCEDFEVKDSSGFFFVSVPKNCTLRQTYIKVRDKRKRNQIWTDSVLFRIKRVPKPIAQLGSLEGNGYYNNGEIAIQNRLYAYLDGFVMSGVKYEVISYRVNAFCLKNLSIARVDVRGNEIHEIKQFLTDNRGASKIEIDSIIAVLRDNGKNGDTVLLVPIAYFVKGEEDGLFAEINNSKGTSFLSKSNDFNRNVKYGDEKVLMKIDNGDTFIVLERLDSTMQLISLKRYHDDAQGVLKFKVDRVSDTSYLISYFNSKGICVATGKSLNLNYDIYRFQNVYDMHFSNEIDSLFYFMNVQNLIPFGEWKFYYDNGSLLANGNFKAIRIISKVNSSNVNEFRVVCEETKRYQRVGDWVIYDVDGAVKLIRDFDHP